ncbi:MAG: cytochrome b/b6 domain-containing protein [Afipia felis]|nr:cytochrome b/b6 domain-containing protein [Afipia felis]
MSAEDDHSRSHVYVWDLPLRIAHWSLAASIVVAWLSAIVLDSLHRWAGYVAIALVAFRIVWGFVGSDSARLNRLTFLLPNAIRFLRRLMRGRTGGYVGLNPAGALMLVASLSLTLISGISGWMQITVRFFGIEWVQMLHTWSSCVLLVLAGVHILGVVAVSIMQRQNLVLAMFTGRKRKKISRTRVSVRRGAQSSFYDT